MNHNNNNQRYHKRVCFGEQNLPMHIKQCVTNTVPPDKIFNPMAKCG